MVLILTATGLWAAGGSDSDDSASAEKEMVTDPTTGKVVTAPEYGGRITYGLVRWFDHSDAWYLGGQAAQYIGLVNEWLGIGDWGINRDEWAWRLLADTPLSFFKGALAESWETPDDTTIIFNIRKGVQWHDKAPMNGRELTAKDVEYNFHRLLGLGKFSEAGPSPLAGGMQPANYESVTATDDWTVVFKLKKLQDSLVVNWTWLCRDLSMPGWLSRGCSYC